MNANIKWIQVVNQLGDASSPHDMQRALKRAASVRITSAVTMWDASKVGSACFNIVNVEGIVHTSALLNHW